VTQPWWSRIEILLLVLTLSACGGGGGGGGGGSSALIAAQGAALNDSSVEKSRLGGHVDYEHIANPNGPLDYAGTVNRPVRGA